MNDAFYFLAVRIIAFFYWRRVPYGAEKLPKLGPAVIIGNHLGPKGPLGAVCSFHRRFYPWIVADMVDRKLAADYLRWDFVESSLKLKPPLSNWIARGLSLISVPLLTSLGGVPVDRDDYDQLQYALKATVTLLKQGKAVMIFPEDPQLELDPRTNMRPFMKGFTRLGELFYQETGQKLNFYPIAVHGSKQLLVGEPTSFDPENPPAMEKHRLKALLEARIKDMYLELDDQTH
jgi:hypothetical protein